MWVSGIRPRIAKAILSKKTKQEASLPGFRQYYKATVIKTVWYLYKNRYRDLWNRILNPGINADTYGQLIFGKGGKNIKWEKVSSASGVGKTRKLHVNQLN